MERAKVPLKISPAGMFTLSNKTFANVILIIQDLRSLYLLANFQLIQKAYSLFTVLQRMDVTVT